MQKFPEIFQVNPFEKTQMNISKYVTQVNHTPIRTKQTTYPIMKTKLLTSIVIAAFALLAPFTQANAGDSHANASRSATTSSTSQRSLEAAGAATAGAAVGAGVATTVGTIGIAVGGTAVAVGTAPFVAAGAVVGLAGYGIYRIFVKD